MNIEINPNKQYIIGVDISGSMTSKDSKTGEKTRYETVLEKIQSFIQASADFDPDGPTVVLFGESVIVYPNTTLEAVNDKLQNPKFESYTNTHLLVKEAFSIHTKEKAAQGGTHEGTVLLVFTDGDPTNRKALASEIVSITNAIEKDEEFSISFLTVGAIDAALEAFLTKLDDELTSNGAKYDIVDVKDSTDISFLAAVAGAIND